MAILQQHPRFEFLLNVAEEVEWGTEWENFKAFINGIRDAMHVRFVLEDLPVLTPMPSAEIFHVVLSTEQCTITLWLRCDDLYVIGYKVRDGRWQELGNQRLRHQIAGAEWAGVGLSYLDFSKTGVHRSERVFGKHQFINALNQLDPGNDPDYPDPVTIIMKESSLRVIIQLVSEAIRLEGVSDHIILRWYADEKLPTKAVELQTQWSHLSRLVLDHTDRNVDFVVNEELFNKIKISKIQEAKEALGIVHDSNDVNVANQPGGPGKKGKPLADVGSSGGALKKREDRSGTGGKAGKTSKGKNVQDDSQSSKGKNVQAATGDSQASKGMNIQECIDDALLLTGLNKPVLAYDRFCVGVDATNDNEELHRLISWMPSFGPQYDKLRWKVIHSESNSVCVNYVVFRDAVEAFVDITVVEGNENPTLVNGIIVARNSNVPIESVLFCKAANECIDLWHGQLIPLSKSIVAVPCESSLIIEAQLRVEDSAIVKGIVEFTAQYSGTAKRRISCEYGEIEVTVTWNRDEI